MDYNAVIGVKQDQSRKCISPCFYAGETGSQCRPASPRTTSSQKTGDIQAPVLVSSFFWWIKTSKSDVDSHRVACWSLSGSELIWTIRRWILDTNKQENNHWTFCSHITRVIASAFTVLTWDCFKQKPISASKRSWNLKRFIPPSF